MLRVPLEQSAMSEDKELPRIVICNAQHPHFPDNRIRNTKYTVYSFLPKTLYDQFKRPINIYFLFIAIIQLNDGLSPVHPATTWGPLLFVLLVSMFSELVDDIRRRRSDLAANSRLYSRCSRGKLQRLRSMDIMVGDILFLHDNDEIPADCVLLKSSDAEGTAYIQTTNLDGESDFKPRSAPKLTQAMHDSEVGGFRGLITASAPDAAIYHFDAHLTAPTDGAARECASSRRDSATSSPSRVHDTSQRIPLSSEQLLLATTHLRNTGYVFAVVVHTGEQTKFGQNKRNPPYKAPQVDRLIDRIAVALFVFQLILASTFGALGYSFYDETGRRLLYLGYATDPAAASGQIPANGVWPALPFALVFPVRFLTLISVMIPISLRITLEICRVAYARWIDWDLEMYDEVSGTPADARTTALSEDLGQIEYVLTDKTGTLTDNTMSFKKASIANVMYGHSISVADVFDDDTLKSRLRSGAEDLLDFFRGLSLCNTAFPGALSANAVGSHSRAPHGYTSPSPDEEALCSAATAFGVALAERYHHDVVLRLRPGGPKSDRLERWTLLHTLEFSSERKRMSVIVRQTTGEKKGRTRIYCKGADDTLLGRLWPGQDVGPCKRHIEAFAGMGLRTLVVACRDLEDDEYEAWAVRHKAASTAITDRAVRLAAVYEEIEKELHMLGASAIEDRLQEGVPGTIALLRRANIRFWMLTGDKQGTAVQVGRACRLLSPPGTGVFLIDIRGTNEDEVGGCIADHLRSYLEGRYSTSAKARAAGQTHEDELCLVIESAALAFALQHHEASFSKLALACHCVVCCRVTPQQKALVVKLVKKSGKLSLSIGDGGNDVPMIQEAHIGVGLSGKEGLQAARASDFALARFRFLSRLLLVHGRHSYKRTCTVALYSFYRSIFLCAIQARAPRPSSRRACGRAARCPARARPALASSVGKHAHRCAPLLPQLFHNTNAAFSGVSLFPSLFFSVWSIITLPFAFSFALDKDIDDESCITFPALYADAQKARFLSLNSCARWAFFALTQGAIVYYLALGVFGPDYMHPKDGIDDDVITVGMGMCASLPPRGGKPSCQHWPSHALHHPWPPRSWRTDAARSCRPTAPRARAQPGTRSHTWSSTLSCTPSMRASPS